jgi:hypothetical protein
VQFVASAVVLVIGVGLGLFADATDIRVFGWVLAGLGALGLVARSLLTRRR